MNAVVIYEDLGVADRLIPALREDFRRAHLSDQLAVKLWRLDLLNWPSLGGEALGDAVEANLVVLAGRGMAHPAAWFMAWLEAWALRREIDDAALAVFEGGCTPSTLRHGKPELCAFAARHHLTLLCGMACSTGIGTRLVNLEQLPLRPSPITERPWAPPGGLHDHWGINE